MDNIIEIIPPEKPREALCTETCLLELLNTFIRFVYSIDNMFDITQPNNKFILVVLVATSAATIDIVRLQNLILLTLTTRWSHVTDDGFIH